MINKNTHKHTRTHSIHTHTHTHTRFFQPGVLPLVSAPGLYNLLVWRWTVNACVVGHQCSRRIKALNRLSSILFARSLKDTLLGYANAGFNNTPAWPPRFSSLIVLCGSTNESIILSCWKKPMRGEETLLTAPCVALNMARFTPFQIYNSPSPLAQW